MKLNLIILGISILAAYGCSPQSQQPTEQAGPNSSSALPSMLLRNDPPNCDSEDTREIVKSILGKHGDQWQNYTSRKICFSKVPTKIYRSVFLADNCETLLDNEITRTDKVLKEYESYGMKSTPIYKFHDENIQELKLIRQNLAVHNDVSFSYKSYLVKSENRAPDGNSIKCSLRVVPQIDSQSAGYTYSPENEWYEINLTLYKLDQNGERAYEYDGPLLRKAE